MRDEVYSLFESWGLDLPEDLNDHTPLFESGLFDSLALFNLASWIENQVGHAVDPAQFDLRREWATVDDIVHFIERGQDSDPAHDQHGAVSAPHPATDDGYRIGKYRPEFKAQVAQLQTGLWSPDVELNTRYLEWKYERNPYGSTPPHVYLAFLRDELVGMRGFSESRWEVGSRDEMVLVADDLVIRDDHRGRGLFTRIMDAAFADLAGSGFNYAFNLSGSPINVLGSLTMGWKRVGVLDPMGTRPAGIRLRQRLRSVIRNMPAIWRFAGSPALYSRTEKRPFLRIDQVIAAGGRDETNGMTFSKQPRLPDMVELIHGQSHDGRIRHLRDPEYLLWRYENPLQEYRFLYLHGERFDGYIAMSRSVASHLPTGRVTVADIEARDDDSFFALLGAAVARVRELYVWTATMSDARRSVLNHFGFLPVDQQRTSRGCPCILVRPLSKPAKWDIDGLSLLDMNAWDIRVLYGMVA